MPLNSRFILEDSDIEMYSTYNEIKSVAAERLTKTLRNKIYKHMKLCQKCLF